MPIYDFVCEECGNEVEVLQKINDAPLKDCPSCNQPTMKKKVTAAAFRLSGSGWYETDFKSGNKKNLKESEKTKPKENKSKPEKSSSSSEGASTENKK